MATDKQRIAFFKLWNHASADVCAEMFPDSTGAPDEREARHRWIRQCTNGRTDNINAVQPGGEFAKLMMLTAEAAGNYVAAGYWELDTAKRWRWLTGEMLRQLGEITQTEKTWEYAQGVLAHRHYPLQWEDVPERDLEILFQQLDTHRRRLLNRDHGWDGLRKSDTDPLRFYHNAYYYRRQDGRLSIGFKVAAPDAQTQDPAESPREAKLTKNDSRLRLIGSRG